MQVPHSKRVPSEVMEKVPEGNPLQHPIGAILVKQHTYSIQVHKIIQHNQRQWIHSTAVYTVHTYTVEHLYSGHLRTKKDCPDYEVVLISGVEDVLWQALWNIWFQWYVSTLEGCLQFRGLD